jgi:hypothetical protein
MGMEGADGFRLTTLGCGTMAAVQQEGKGNHCQNIIRLRVTFFLTITVHITDYHWDRHSYFVIHSYHAQTMTHTPPSMTHY